MFVAVMDVRVMRMAVAHPFVAMHVTVRLRQQFWIVVMPMMFVVTMTMFVFHRFVHVLVYVFFRQM
jgi:hypothetical protein